MVKKTKICEVIFIAFIEKYCFLLESCFDGSSKFEFVWQSIHGFDRVLKECIIKIAVKGKAT